VALQAGVRVAAKTKAVVGTVVMASVEEAEQAVLLFDGADMAGRPLKVRVF
jgi:hypothetical protein